MVRAVLNVFLIRVEQHPVLSIVYVDTFVRN